VERDATVAQLAAQLVRCFPRFSAQPLSLAHSLCVFLLLAMFVCVCAGGARRITVGLAVAAGVYRGAV
jgi:hypothetical protein